MTCRICQGRDTTNLLSYDSLPIAGCYVEVDHEGPEPELPMTVQQCLGCGLVQLEAGVKSSFYEDYRFVGDVSGGYRAHMERVAQWITQIADEGSLVVEVGASNGALLEMLQSRLYVVGGFEPAAGPCRQAQRKGLDVLPSPVNAETGRVWESDADVIVVRHVMEHIDDLEAFMEGLEVLAHQDTALVIEVPDLTSTVRAGLHTNFYHPHVNYFDQETLSTLLQRHGWTLHGGAVVDIFGGSLLVAAHRQERQSAPDWPAPEGAPMQLLWPGELDSFRDTWRTRSEALLDFLLARQEEGLVVDGYGAAERTVAALGYARVGPGLIRFLYDRNPLLKGSAVPGCRIPILPPEAMGEDFPDMLVIFASSHEEEIIAQQAGFLAQGGLFVSLRGDKPTLVGLSSQYRRAS